MIFFFFLNDLKWKVWEVYVLVRFDLLVWISCVVIVGYMCRGKVIVIDFMWFFNFRDYLMFGDVCIRFKGLGVGFGKLDLFIFRIGNW